MVIVSELHDILRFDSPDKLMSYLGLIPSENSSGDKQNRGGITKAGNSRVRRILIEAAKHQQNKPGVNRALAARRKGQEAWIIKIANKCHKRLHQRYGHLIHSGKVHNKATAAVARELVGFVWSVLHTLAEIVPDEGAA